VKKFFLLPIRLFAAQKDRDMGFLFVFADKSTVPDIGMIRQ